eukprot:4941980-Amphidinium_carterae.1
MAKRALGYEVRTCLVDVQSICVDSRQLVVASCPDSCNHALVDLSASNSRSQHDLTNLLIVSG